MGDRVRWLLSTGRVYVIYKVGRASVVSRVEQYQRLVLGVRIVDLVQVHIYFEEPTSRYPCMSGIDEKS